jgi:biofilm PGA synthesis N-glycosyltransferase PgaC
MTLTYALITPARDEADNLRRLAECVASQTVAPQRWVIVDNDSSDESRVVAAGLAHRHDWVRVISTSASRAAEPGAPIVRAFHAGLRELDGPADVIVKLDADVSMNPAYFENLLRAFRDDPALGIASGECLEQDGGEWTLRPVTHGHARGATRAYRWECLQAVLPLPERVGWDTVDEVKANVGGWRTGTIPGLSFHHHRTVGERDGAPWARWVTQGSAAHYLGYRFSYLVLRTLHRTLQQPAAIGMLVGYAAAAVRREKRCDDPRIRVHLRRRQSLRRLPLRVREAFGRQRGSVGV